MATVDELLGITAETPKAIDTSPDQPQETPESSFGRYMSEYGPAAASTYAGGKLGFELGGFIPHPAGRAAGALIGAGLGAAGGSALTDVLLKRPISKASAAIQGLVSAVGGPLLSGATGMALRASKAVRPVARTLARETIESKLMTPEALSAKQFYADSAARTNTFTDMHGMLQKLKYTADKLDDQGQSNVAAPIRARIATLERTLENQFPGFKAAQKGYHRLKSIDRAHQIIEEADPLKVLEKDLAISRVGGRGEAPLVKGGGPVTGHFRPAESEEIRQILDKLGPDPGTGIWQKMVAGHAVGAGVGVATGAGAYAGGTVGGAMALVGPKTLNAMIAGALRHPATRAFVERSLKKGLSGKGMADPQFWSILSSLGARLGIEGFRDQE